MRRFSFVMRLVGVAALSFFVIQPAPAYAASAGCIALDGATFTTTVNDPFITAPTQFNAGDTVVYRLFFNFPNFTPTSVTVQISLGTVLNPVASATVTNSPAGATVSYTFTSSQLTELRFDWGFTGTGAFAPHTISTLVSCGDAAAPIPTLSEWALLLLTLALAAVGMLRLRRS